ncbi:hypothetical protein FBZ94_105497 [Bradyrhizobium sacchari]|uniref:Uncharacterized protein n=1 Tax=Bradyrhizobium sacchari TaxID=1399419 RepID=A0A560JPD2_9BRAD|nr:hypothetical protein FBZ94_105497 [Bradyrhizobium sacchari]TWB72419.1 hypothetical protein FBZ95_106134 [Bradyrhizobium sacchari]
MLCWPREWLDHGRTLFVSSSLKLQIERQRTAAIHARLSPQPADRLAFRRSTRTRLNSSGPSSRCRLLAALSSAVRLALIISSIVSPAILRARRSCLSSDGSAPFTLRPLSTSSHTACDKVSLSAWRFAHLTIAARSRGVGRKTIEASRLLRLFIFAFICTAGFGGRRDGRRHCTCQGQQVAPASVPHRTDWRTEGQLSIARARNAPSRVSCSFAYNIVSLIKPSSIWPSANRSRASCSNRLRCLCR